MDISQHNLDRVTQLAERDIAANKLPASIKATLDQREAITDSDYVICVIRQGGLEAFALDINIPLKYGVDQCVGYPNMQPKFQTLEPGWHRRKQTANV